MNINLLVSHKTPQYLILLTSVFLTDEFLYAAYQEAKAVCSLAPVNITSLDA
jgi:hypothetical protein